MDLLSTYSDNEDNGDFEGRRSPVEATVLPKVQIAPPPSKFVASSATWYPEVGSKSVRFNPEYAALFGPVEGNTEKMTFNPFHLLFHRRFLVHRWWLFLFF
jgi:hypothetical protein